MTNKEAVDILNNTSFFGRSAEDIDEALNMAIDALQDEDCVLKLFGECSYNKTGCSDCEIKEKIRTALQASEWIPFNEKIPEKDGDYLVCYEDGYREDFGLPEIGIASFESDCDGFGEWIDYYDEHTLGFVDSDWSETKVKAWMPLPEAYKEEDVLISRKDALKAIEKLIADLELEIKSCQAHPEQYTDNFECWAGEQISGMAHASQAILELPSAEGHWISGNGNGECSVCHHERQEGWDNFCGFCGTKMRKE